jgi:hypothetical protein
VRQLVELGDLVPKRAPRRLLVAKGRAARHAARRLRLQLLLFRGAGRGVGDLVPVVHALSHGPVLSRQALVAQKAVRLDGLFAGGQDRRAACLPRGGDALEGQARVGRSHEQLLGVRGTARTATTSLNLNHGTREFRQLERARRLGRRRAESGGRQARKGGVGRGPRFVEHGVGDSSGGGGGRRGARRRRGDERG